MSSSRPTKRRRIAKEELLSGKVFYLDLSESNAEKLKKQILQYGGVRKTLIHICSKTSKDLSAIDSIYVGCVAVFRCQSRYTLDNGQKATSRSGYKCIYVEYYELSWIWGIKQSRSQVSSNWLATNQTWANRPQTEGYSCTYSAQHWCKWVLYDHS